MAIPKTLLFRVSPLYSIRHHFAGVTDNRKTHNKIYPLPHIIFMAITAVVGGADTWTDIEQFVINHAAWYAKQLDMTHGVPSHDTFGKVFMLVDAKQFQQCFAAWMQSLRPLPSGLELKVRAIDGKTNRRTFGGKTKDGSFTKALHMVSAFASDNGVVLGQVATDQKSNEITAIPELLQLLDIKGCLVTTDAMGCQGDIAADIVARGGDYLLAVKGNQGNLYRDIKAVFKNRAIPRERHTTTDTGHGRVDVRTCEVISMQAVKDKIRHNNNWVKLNSIVRVTAVRTKKCNGKTTTSTFIRYYICSLSKAIAKQLNQAVRAHWGIENNLHWVIDMAFREDESRIRTGQAPANMAALRHIALNLIRQDTARKIGIKA